MKLAIFSVKQWLYIIVAGSFLLSLGYSFYHRIEPVVDARAYDVIAQNIVAGNGFREDTGKPILYDPGILRAGPGYEYFLAALYKIFGHHYEVVWIAQAFLHALTALLVFLTAKKLFAEKGEIIGLVAAFAVAIHPDLIEISAMLMTETLYLFTEMLLLFLFAKSFTEEKNYWTAALLGITAGLSILTRPPLLLFLAIILIFFLIKRRLAETILIVVLFGLMLTPWTIRNYRIYRTFMPTTLISEYNLWVGNTLTSSGGQFSDANNPATTFGEKNGYARFDEKSRSVFKTFLVKYPLRFIKLTFLRFVRYMSLIRPMGFWFYQFGFSQLIFVALSLLATAILFITGFAGLFFLIWTKHPFARYLAAFAVASIVALLPAVVESRYRFQIHPLFALAAGALIVHRQDEHPLAFQSLRLGAFFLTIVSLIDATLFFKVIIEHLETLFV